MIGKILLLLQVMRICNAVIVDTSSNHYKQDLVKTSPHGWQVVKVYHPPTPTYGYKYEHYTYPKYEFEYAVSDKKTGDHKHHQESRDGDRVRGEYSLVESDGSLRKVEYEADDHSGFNAVVSKTINKHGDHAISKSAHTRFFYPVGHNIKINHYFPGKDYQYQEIEKPENQQLNKPVHEESLSTTTNDDKMLVIQSGDKFTMVEPAKLEEQNMNDSGSKDVVLVFSTPKPEAVTATPVQVVPAVVSMIPESIETDTPSKETVDPLSTVEQINNSDVREPSSQNVNQNMEKEEQDSDVASSFYHSKIYYLSY